MKTRILSATSPASFHRARTALTLAVILFGAASDPAEAREPTDIEQYYLELVNRARAAPQAEVDRLAGEVWGDTGSPAAPGLNEGIAPGTITASPKPPLAFDTRLIQAASNYSDFLLANEQFSHFADGTVQTRIEAAGYLLLPAWGIGENLAISSSTGPHPVNAARAEQHHRNLFIDGDVPGRGHRLILMDADFREVGIAIRADANGISFFPGSANDVLSTQKFAFSQGRVFLTGVVYHDLNSNGLYDPGESAGVLDLRVVNASDATVASGTTFASGGYSLNLASLPAGSYTLVARDSAGDEESAAFVWSGSQNLKLDLVDPSFTAPPGVGPPPATLPSYLPDLLVGTTPRSLRGGGVFARPSRPTRLRILLRNRAWSRFVVRLRNGGTESDTIRLSLLSRENRFFQIRVAPRSPNANVALQPGQSRDLRGRARLRPAALGRRQISRVRARAVSLNEVARQDSVEVLLVNRSRRSP